MRKFESKTKSPEVDQLLETILSMESLDELYRFFEDLCTMGEMKAMAERFQVAKLLSERKTYIDIEDKTGASAATISRVNKFLYYGNDGYKLGLDRMKSRNIDESDK